LTPEDVGLVHTDAFEQLTDLYKDTDNLPKSKIELMMQVSEIMEGYCDEDDTSCRNLAYEATMKEFNIEKLRNPSEIAYPDDFHAGLKGSIDQMFETIKQIDEHNVDEVVDTLNEITNQMKDLEDVNALHQAVALSTMSVAVESTKLWHNVLITEKEHPLRRLQIDIPDALDFLPDIISDCNTFIWNIENSCFGVTESVSDVYLIIIADVSATIQNGANFLGTVSAESPDAILLLAAWPFIVLIYFAIPGSALAAASIFGRR